MSESEILLSLNDAVKLLEKFREQCPSHVYLQLSPDHTPDAKYRFEGRAADGRLLLEAVVSSTKPELLASEKEEKYCVLVRCLSEKGELELFSVKLEELLAFTKEALKHYIQELFQEVSKGINLLVNFKKECSFHTSLQLSDDDALDERYCFEGYSENNTLLLEACVNEKYYVVLRCLTNQGEQVLYSNDLALLVMFTKEALKEYVKVPGV